MDLAAIEPQSVLRGLPASGRLRKIGDRTSLFMSAGRLSPGGENSPRGPWRSTAGNSALADHDVTTVPSAQAPLLGAALFTGDRVRRIDKNAAKQATVETFDYTRLGLQHMAQFVA
jgi:hypothetical protein